MLLSDDGRVIEPRERTVADLVDDVARTLREPGVTTMRKASGDLLLVVCSGQQAPLEAEMPAVTSTTPLDRPPDATVLTPVGAALSQGRRRPVLVVWRQGAERGFQLCHRGTVENAHVWSADWRLLPLDPGLDEDFREFLRSWLEVAAGDADLLLARLEVTDVEAARVRALLRRAPGPDVLEQFCELLGLPSELAHVVEGADPADLPGSHLVTPTTMARTVLGAAREEPSAKDPWLVRVRHAKPWWYRAGNAVWVPVGSWWAIDLWSGGGPGRVVAVGVFLTAVVSLVVAVRPPRTRPAP